MIFHGLAGHFFLQQVPHVLKVRISGDMDDRVREEMQREGISANEARAVLVNDDNERRKWGLQMYGQDTWNPLLYDVVLHLQNMQVDDAVAIILQALKQPCFQSTPDSRRWLDDLALAARVEAALVKEFPRIKADAGNGAVFVSVRGSRVDEKLLTEKVKRLTEKVREIESLQVNVVPFVVEE